VAITATRTNQAELSRVTEEEDGCSTVDGGGGFGTFAIHDEMLSARNRDGREEARFKEA